MNKLNVSDGGLPTAAMVQGLNGDLYGTTYTGGGGYGTVFSITTGGTIFTLHNFHGPDGANPYAGLVFNKGKFYGTTANGGANNACSGGCGTVFSISITGVLTTLHSFDGPDGSNPYGGLVVGKGRLYGTTSSGGANNACSGGCGTVFSISTTGVLKTLHSFDETDGNLPYGTLVQAFNGTFYGTTIYGGTNNDGTLFSITPAGLFATLHNFDFTDGAYPYAGMIQGNSAYEFYGTTYQGGTSGVGTVFKINSVGALTTLLTSTAPTAGTPRAGLSSASTATSMEQRTKVGPTDWARPTV